MTGYWKDGRFVVGQTVKTAGDDEVGALDLQVAAAVARARETGNPRIEIANLLKDHPILKNDVPEMTWDRNLKQWIGHKHPLTEMAILLAQEIIK